MSDPKIDFQQLLSDHLDGWLSGDELDTLERQLSNDSELRSQYQAMLEDRKSLRAMFAQDSPASLPPSFATDVMAEAIGRRDGTAVSEDPSASPMVALDHTQTASHRSVMKIAIIATAASVLMMLSLLFASIDPGSQVAETTPEPLSNVQPLIEPELADMAVAAPMIAKTDLVEATLDDPNSAMRSQADTTVESAAPAQAMIASGRPVSPETTTQPELNGMPSPSAIASATPTRSATPQKRLDMSSAVAMSATPDDTLSGAVLVYDVRLTSRGRITQPLKQAMQQVGLAETSRQPIDGALITAAKSVDTFDPEASFQILYLRASAKRLDRLFETLLIDRENVSSVGLSLVTESPILKITDDLERVDATLIQRKDRVSGESRAASYELDPKQRDELAVLRRLLGDQTYIPVTPGTSGLTTDNEATSGRDIMSRVLVIIR